MYQECKRIQGKGWLDWLTRGILSQTSPAVSLLHPIEFSSSEHLQPTPLPFHPDVTSVPGISCFLWIRRIINRKSTAPPQYPKMFQWTQRIAIGRIDPSPGLAAISLYGTGNVSVKRGWEGRYFRDVWILRNVIGGWGTCTESVFLRIISSNRG